MRSHIRAFGLKDDIFGLEFQQKKFDAVLSNVVSIKAGTYYEIDRERDLQQKACNFVAFKPRMSRFFMCPSVHYLGTYRRLIFLACSYLIEHIISFLLDLFIPVVENLSTNIKQSSLLR